MGNGRATSTSRSGGTIDLPRDGAEVPVWHSFRAYAPFRTLFYSTLASNSVFWMWNIAVGWLALILTDSPFFVGLTSFIGGIPILIFTLPGGVLLDRVDRRRVLLIAQAIVLVAASGMAGMLLLDWLRPWHLLAFAFANGTAMSFVFPARNVLVANLVPAHDLANAVALNSAGQNATRVIGPALAGPLLAILGVKGTFVAAAAVQALAMAITFQLPKVPPASSAARRTLWGSMTEGLGLIWRSEYLTGLVILAAIPTMFLMPYSSLLPVFARDEMAIGATGLGVLMSFNGLGGVVGSLLVAGSRRLMALPGVLIWSAGGFGLSVLAFALTPNPLLAGSLIFLAGLISAIYMAINNTKIQLSVDDSVRGRVLSVYMLTWGLLPLGTLPIGAVADIYGAPLAVAGTAALAVLLIGFSALRFPSLLRPDPAPVEAPARART